MLERGVQLVRDGRKEVLVQLELEEHVCTQPMDVVQAEYLESFHHHVTPLLLDRLST